MTSIETSLVVNWAIHSGWKFLENVLFYNIEPKFPEKQEKNILGELGFKHENNIQMRHFWQISKYCEEVQDIQNREGSLP